MDPDLEKRRRQAIAIAQARARLAKEPKPKTVQETVGDIAQVTASALSPYAAAAGTGAVAGAPFAGVGAIPGAVAGVTALGAGDIGTSLYNLAAPIFGGRQVQLPSETIRRGLYEVGVGKAPETAGGRIYHDVLSAAGGAGVSARGANLLAQQMAAAPAQNRTAQYMLEAFGQQPGVQAAAAGAGAGAPSALREAGVTNELALMGTGLAAGMGGGMAANRMFTPKPVEAPIPSIEDIREQSQEAYKRSAKQGAVFSNPSKQKRDTATLELKNARDALKGVNSDPTMPGPISRAIQTSEDIFKKVGRPVPEELKDLTGADKARAYVKAAEEAAAAPTYKTLLSNIDDALEQTKTFNPTAETPIRSVLRSMKSVRSDKVTFEQLGAWNTLINDAMKGQNDAVVRWGMAIKEAIDDFILDPRSAAVGDSPAAARALEEGRALWTKMRKSETIEEAIDKAQRNIDRGQDPVAAIKTQFNGMVNNRKQFRLFTKEEQAAIRSVIKGSKDQKMMEMLGSLIPGGKDLGSILPLMFAGITGIPGAFAIIGSAAAKSTANRMAREQAERVSGFMRGGQLQAPQRPSARAPAGIGAAKGVLAEDNQNAMRR